MIVRYGGGNDGIVDYLINGRKAERQYTRDELDHRVVLDGDLQTTDKIIDSIENKSQERYLHITLSFHESHVSNEVLKAVVDDYKKLLMNAFILMNTLFMRKLICLKFVISRIIALVNLLKENHIFIL